MHCQCRATPWRTFIQGLAQVHNLQISTRTARPWRTASALPPPTSYSRRFTASSGWRQEATRSAVAPENAIVSDKAAVADAAERQTVAEAKRARRNRKTDGKSDSEPLPWKSTKVRANDTSPAVPTPKHKHNKFKSLDQTSDPTAANPKTPDWKGQKAALKEKFPEGWQPRKRLSPDALAGIRALNAQFPDTYTTEALADKFEVSVESIRRILKSKWTPSAQEEQDRQERWFRRGMQVWERKAALGVKPPKRWRREGIVRDSAWHERKRGAIKRERKWEEQEREDERTRRNYGEKGGDGFAKPGGSEGGKENGKGGW